MYERGGIHGEDFQEQDAEISNHFIERYKTERLSESGEVIRKRSCVIVSCYAIM